QVPYFLTNASALRSSASSDALTLDLLVSKLTWIVSLSVAFFGVTPTLAVSEREPPGPSTVIVYRVVLEGQTSLEPLGLTLPTPGSMEALVAFVAVHESVVHLPSSIEFG